MNEVYYKLIPRTQKPHIQITQPDNINNCEYLQHNFLYQEYLLQHHAN